MAELFLSNDKIANVFLFVSCNEGLGWRHDMHTSTSNLVVGILCHMEGVDWRLWLWIVFLCIFPVMSWPVRVVASTLEDFDHHILQCCKHVIESVFLGLVESILNLLDEVVNVI